MDDARIERWTRQWIAEIARDPKGARSSANAFSTLVMLAPAGILLALAMAAGVGSAVMIIPWVAAQVFGGLIIAVALILAGIIIASMPTKIREPRGVKVLKSEVPLLFDKANKAAKALGVKAPSTIRLDAGDKVTVTWWGKRGFSGCSGHLHVGIAAVAMLENDEMDSVITLALAHMLEKDAAHLRGVQHAYAWWSEIEAKVQPKLDNKKSLWHQIQSYVLSVTLGAVMHAVVPRLGGMERAFWRDRELASDRSASSATSRLATCRALVRLQVRARWWRTEVDYLLDATQRTTPIPEASFAAKAALCAGGEIAPVVAGSVVFARALTEPDDPYATNAPIGKRLSAVGLGIDRAGVEQVTFADAAAWGAAPASGDLWNHCFPAGVTAKVLQRVGAEWARENSSPWRESHQELAELDRKGKSLAAVANQKELRADEYLLIAGWARSQYGREMARDWLRYALHVDPYHAGAALELGRELVMAGDQGGVSWLETAAQLAPDLADESQAWVAAWYRACGDQPSAEARVERRGKHRQEMRNVKWTSFDVRKKSRVAGGMLPTDRERRIVRAIASEHPSVVLAAVARHDIRTAPMGRMPLTVAIELQQGTSDTSAEQICSSFAKAMQRAWLGSKIDQVEVVWSVQNSTTHKMWTDIRNSAQTFVWNPEDEARREAAAQQMPVVAQNQVMQQEEQVYNTPIQPALQQQPHQQQSSMGAPPPPVTTGITPPSGAFPPPAGGSVPVPPPQVQQPPAA